MLSSNQSSHVVITVLRTANFNLIQWDMLFRGITSHVDSQKYLKAEGCTDCLETEFRPNLQLVALTPTPQ